MKNQGQFELSEVIVTDEELDYFSDVMESLAADSIPGTPKSGRCYRCSRS